MLLLCLFALFVRQLELVSVWVWQLHRFVVHAAELWIWSQLTHYIQIWLTASRYLRESREENPGFSRISQPQQGNFSLKNMHELFPITCAESDAERYLRMAFTLHLFPLTDNWTLSAQVLDKHWEKYLLLKSGKGCFLLRLWILYVYS